MPNLCVCFLVQVRGFTTPAEVDQWLQANPLQSTGALHFILGNSSSNSTVQRLGYGIQTNSTTNPKRGYYEDPTLKFQMPLQIAVEREIARHLMGGESSIHLIHLPFCVKDFCFFTSGFIIIKTTHRNFWNKDKCHFFKW